tara:strand:+ start:175 stop:621 length:447 start_codon:yes stop_codon:yes gene_type:complete
MIIESLLAANAAFKLIKETLDNGGEVMSAGKAIGDWMGASREISKHPASKSATFGSAFEGFQAQEEIRIQREQLEFMIKKTRLNAWRDFVAYEVEYYREQREAEKLARRKEYKRAKALQENLTLLAKVFGTLFIIMGALVGVAIYLRP